MENTHVHPLSGNDIIQALEKAGLPTSIKRYADFAALSDIEQDQLLMSSPRLILWINGGDNSGGVGHWTAIARTGRNRLDFFSSYGTVPDGDQNELNPGSKEVPGQEHNSLGRCLARIHDRYGLGIHFLGTPFQYKGDKTTSCGAWVWAFLVSRLNIEEFEKMIRFLTPTQNWEQTISWLWNNR